MTYHAISETTSTYDQENATYDPLSLDNQLCFALYSASLAMTKTYKPLLDELGLTYPQYLVMLVLWQQDGILVKDIGQRLFLDSGTLTPLLKRLEATSLIVRTRDTTDERQVRITLTPKGRSLHAQATKLPDKIVCASGQELNSLEDLRSQLSLVRQGLLAHIDTQAK